MWPPDSSNSTAPARSFQSPAPRPAKSAAPRAVDSVWGLRRMGWPSTSAWNWRNASDRAMPPSTLSSRECGAEVILDGLDQVRDLKGDAFESGPGDVGQGRCTGEPEQGSPRRGLPVRGAQARQGGHEGDPAVGIRLKGKGADLGSRADGFEAVAEPLHRRAGNEHAPLQGILRAARRPVRPPGS